MKLTPRSFSLNVLSQILVKILLILRGIIIIPILAKTFGKFEYGLWTQLIITVNLLSSILTLRFDIVLVRYFSAASSIDQVRIPFISMLAAIGIVLCGFGIGVVLFSEQVSHWVFNESHLNSYVFILFALGALRTLFLYTLSFYRSSHRILVYSLIQSFQILGEVILLILTVVIWEADLLTSFRVLVLFNGVVTALAMASVLVQTGISLPDFRLLSPYLAFALPLIPNVSLQWVISFSDRYVITHLEGLGSAGIYAASYSLGQFISFFVAPVGFVLYPVLVKFWEEKKNENVQKWIRVSLKFFFFLAIPALFGMDYFAPDVLTQLASREFADHHQLVFIIGSGFVFMGVGQFYLYLMHLQEKTQWVLLIFTIIATLNLSLNFILVPQIGLKGAAVATFISYALQASILYILANRKFRMSLPYQFLIKSIFSASFMWIIFQTVVVNKGWEKIIVAGLGTLIYLAGLILTKAVSKDEFKLLYRMFIPSKNKV